jgi:twitching motility protein PilT
MFFPPEQQVTMRRQIAGALKATITQRLIPALDGRGRVPAVEISSSTRWRARSSKTAASRRSRCHRRGQGGGSKSFNADLYRLIKEGRITKQDGLANSPNPKALEMNLKGIFLSSGGIVN